MGTGTAVSVDLAHAIAYAVWTLMALSGASLVWELLRLLLGPTLAYLRTHWRKIVAWYLLEWSRRVDPQVLTDICTDVIRRHAADVMAQAMVVRGGPGAVAMGRTQEGTGNAATGHQESGQ